MHHKLQSSSIKNDGKNSVVRKQQAKTNRQKSRDIGSGDRSRNDVRGNSERSSASSTRDSRTRDQEPGRGRPPVRHFIRCEVPHSAGFDPTGERAFACGARAEVICETCGPMCAACAVETFCQSGEHKLVPIPESEPEPGHVETKRPVTPVIYVELKCPKRCRVRLALPQTHRVQSKRKCPVCKAMAQTKYLAHGFTRRQLPFHEVWTNEDEFIKGGEASDDPDFKRRVPWDDRETKWEQNRRR
jgi:hypothetical protein